MRKTRFALRLEIAPWAVSWHSKTTPAACGGTRLVGDDFSEFPQGQSVAEAIGLLAEDADHLTDQGLHPLRRVERVLPFRVLPSVRSHEVLEAGQRAAQAVQNVRRDRPKRGGFGGQCEFLVGSP